MSQYHGMHGEELGEGVKASVNRIAHFSQWSLSLGFACCSGNKKIKHWQQCDIWSIVYISTLDALTYKATIFSLQARMLGPTNISGGARI